MGVRHTITTFMFRWRTETKQGTVAKGLLSWFFRERFSGIKNVPILGSKTEMNSVNLYKINRSFKIKTFRMGSQGQSENRPWDILEELAQLPCKAF